MWDVPLCFAFIFSPFFSSTQQLNEVYWMQDIYLRMDYQWIYLFSMLSILGNSVFILRPFSATQWVKRGFPIFLLKRFMFVLLYRFVFSELKWYCTPLMIFLLMFPFLKSQISSKDVRLFPNLCTKIKRVFNNNVFGNESSK